MNHPWTRRKAASTQRVSSGVNERKQPVLVRSEKAHQCSVSLAFIAPYLVATTGHELEHKEPRMCDAVEGIINVARGGKVSHSLLWRRSHCKEQQWWNH